MFEAAANKHLTGLATWVRLPHLSVPLHSLELIFLPHKVTPSSGMFLYLNLLLSPDPSVQGDSSTLISKTAFEKGVLGVPGVAFMPSRSVTSYVRLAFSLATEAEADEGLRRLREAVLEARAAAAGDV